MMTSVPDAMPLKTRPMFYDAKVREPMKSGLKAWLSSQLIWRSPELTRTCNEPFSRTSPGGATASSPTMTFLKQTSSKLPNSNRSSTGRISLKASCPSNGAKSNSATTTLCGVGSQPSDGSKACLFASTTLPGISGTTATTSNTVSVEPAKKE